MNNVAGDIERDVKQFNECGTTKELNNKYVISTSNRRKREKESRYFPFGGYVGTEVVPIVSPCVCLNNTTMDFIKIL